jgi:hypothetical protein
LNLFLKVLASSIIRSSCSSVLLILLRLLTITV